VSAINAVVGHELFHRKNLFDKVIGTLCYAKIFYGHTFMAHIKCHHKKVATPEDPQTSRLGESVFQFYSRAIIESAVDVWNFENSRLKQQEKEKWWQILAYNRLITFTAGEILFNALIGYAFGTKALCFNLVVSMIATLMFETVNYLEHYGLQRKLLPGAENVYESVNITHSWNAPQVVTNYLLFKLQRHSDHHANSYKPYQILNSFPESPMLPYGYSVCVILCMFPPIWKRVIDPIAIATNNGEKITQEVKTYQERLIFATLFCTSIFLTYVCFFVIGFTPKF
jgi:alkane 1-monooxygenase